MNVRPAPFSLTPGQVKALVDASPTPLVTLTLLPIENATLVDRPRRSANPILSKANDDGR